MSTYGYALLGLTGVVATLAAVFVFALLRFMATARSARRQVREGASDSALLSSALQDAFSSLKAREQAMSARAVASEQLSARVFDSLTAGLIVVDATGRVTIANPAACRMLGVPAEPVGGLRDWLGGSPIADLIAQGLSTRRPIERRLVEVRDQDRARHFGATVSPLGDTGSTTGVICLFSDLTTVVELEQQLQMKEALARLGEMTAGIAHEFRNGLATIHGYSRLMDPDSLPDPYRVYVEGIRQETDTLGRVITNFLNFARPEPLSLTPLDLEVVARRAADELRAELPEDTSLIVDGAFGSIQGDDILLRQVFANLIRNAAEACAIARRRPAIAIAGHVDTAARTAIVSVDDNGPGIPHADRARVFQPFFTTRSRGSGLGLSIVQKIVLLHNGRISVGVSTDGGAQVQLTFPLAA